MPTLSVSRPGDIWELGRHRVICGDGTDWAALAALMAGEKADLVFIDPPYNVNYRGKRVLRAPIRNDNLGATEFAGFLAKAFLACFEFSKEAASLYVCHSALCQIEAQRALEGAGFKVRTQLVWAKDHFTLSFGRYKYQHELLFYCHKKGKADRWHGGKGESTLWQFQKPLKSPLHPTMKPIGLVEKAVRNSSRAGDLVLDTFGGSGTTLIACENLQRTAFLAEIEPWYVDTIVRRWQEHTGETAALAGQATTFDEQAAKQANNGLGDHKAPRLASSISTGATEALP